MFFDKSYGEALISAKVAQRRADFVYGFASSLELAKEPFLKMKDARKAIVYFYKKLNRASIYCSDK